MVATRRQPEPVGQTVADAHGRHDAEIGHSDSDWPDWFAQYMVREQVGGSGEGSPGART